MARDLKINIRKRAIGTFFEYDKLDQAVAGHSNPLGRRFVFKSSVNSLTSQYRDKDSPRHPESYSKSRPCPHDSHQKIQPLLRADG